MKEKKKKDKEEKRRRGRRGRRRRRKTNLKMVNQFLKIAIPRFHNHFVLLSFTKFTRMCAAN